jgi:FkbM family methyltransferase
VLAVEANPALLQRLRKAVAGLQNVRVAATAAGEAAGTATLHIFRQDTRSSLLKDSRASAYTLDAKNRAGVLTVPVAPLLDILREHDIARVDALKIDVEGYEDRVLLPFFKAAPGELWPSWVMIERSHNVWAHDCIEFMQQRGYGEAWSGRSDTLLAKPVAASS